MRNDFSPHLLAWYSRHQRPLPWRSSHPQPYAVWVSEIMAQQTRLDTVLPYYRRWMEAFPSISALAAASQQEVLNLWEGLGYYSRARNLHKAAQIVVRDYGGDLPGEIAALRKLPGIGAYTAGAIASIAFGQDEAVVDGNVKRFLARFFGIELTVDTPQGERAIWDLARAYLPAGQAGTYNQALMDLGATICIPRQPQCTHCPVAADCLAYRQNMQDTLPRKTPKAQTPHYTVTAAILWREERVLIAQRPQDSLLGGMWEFPGGKREDGESLKTCLKREILEELACKIIVGNKFGIFRHAYTHFSVTLHAFECELEEPGLQALYHQQIKWVNLAELDEYPMGKIDRLISQQLQQREGTNGSA